MRIIFFATTEPVFDKDVALGLCKPLLKSVLEAMCINRLRTKEGTEEAYKIAETRKTHAEIYGYRRTGPHTQPETLIDSNVLADCLTRCIQFGWDDLARLFSLKVAADIADVPPEEYRHLWIPFARHLIRHLDAANVPLSTPRYQQLMCAIFEAYLDKQVRIEPSGEEDYSGYGPVSCRACPECTEMNRFLASGERVWHFFAGKERRKHLDDQLRYSSGPKLDCACSHERVGNRWKIVIQKTVDKGAKAKKDWQARFAQAQIEFGNFDQEKLKELLGEDYESITSMREIRLGARPRDRHASAVLAVLGAGTHAGNVMRPTNVVAGVKRRAED